VTAQTAIAGAAFTIALIGITIIIWTLLRKRP
jgi:hypothetical protein